MGKTVYIIAIIFLAVILLGLIIAFFVVRQRAKEAQENGSPFCPIAVCADGSLAQSSPAI